MYMVCLKIRTFYFIIVTTRYLRGLCGLVLKGSCLQAQRACTCMLCSACFLMFKHWFCWKYQYNKYMINFIDHLHFIQHIPSCNLLLILLPLKLNLRFPFAYVSYCPFSTWSFYMQVCGWKTDVFRWRHLNLYVLYATVRKSCHYVILWSINN